MNALSSEWIKGDPFDLVVTNVPKRYTNDYELQDVITQKFELPILLMSADDKEGKILKGLKGVPEDDLRYAVLQEKEGGKSAVKQGKQGKDKKAVPSKILDHMKVPGLTRDNVTSHLQIYRRSLQRITDATGRIQAPDIKVASRANQSTIVSGMLGKYSQFHQGNVGVQSSIPSSSIHTSTGYLTGNMHKNKGKEVDAVLDPVHNFTVFHNVNAMQESQGIGDRSTSMNQGNVQPHQQHNEDVIGANFDGGFNLDMEKDSLKWIDQEMEKEDYLEWFDQDMEEDYLKWFDQEKAGY